MNAPADEARDEYADAMNLELRQSIAARVLEAMDVDQYLIDAVLNAKPPVVKPAIEEPTEWGSVVRARRVGYGAEDTTTLRWQRQNTHDANDSWTSEPAGDLGVRYSSHWSYLHHPEVLRVGVGDTPVPSYSASDVIRATARTMRVCISDVAPCGEQDCNSCFPPIADAAR